MTGCQRGAASALPVGNISEAQPAEDAAQARIRSRGEDCRGLQKESCGGNLPVEHPQEFVFAAIARGQGLN